MIATALTDLARYRDLHPLFPFVCDYIAQQDLFVQAPGRYPLLDDRVIMIVERTPGRSAGLARLECHRRYIDIQLVLDGVDHMGWRSLSTCEQPIASFDEQKDIQFFADSVQSWIATPAGHCCIFFPEDGHAPLVSDDMIHKIIFKIAVSA